MTVVIAVNRGCCFCAVTAPPADLRESNTQENSGPEAGPAIHHSVILLLIRNAMPSWDRPKTPSTREAGTPVQPQQAVHRIPPQSAMDHARYSPPSGR